MAAAMSDEKESEFPLMPSSPNGKLLEGSENKQFARAGNEQGVDYRLSVDAAQIGIWKRELNAGRILISPVMAKILELPPEQDCVNMADWETMIFEDDLPIVHQRISQFPRSGGTFRSEFRVKVGNGRMKWLSIRGATAFDDAGNAVGINGMAIDITDIKVAEEALKESEERFRILAEISPISICVACEGIFVYANQTAADIFADGRVESVVGHSPFSFFHEKHRPLIASRIEQILGSGGAPWIELQLERHDGKVLWLQWTSKKISWNGQPALQVVARDITEEKEAQEKIRVLNERINLALESYDEAVWDVDLQTSTYTFTGGLQNIFSWANEFGSQRIGQVEWENVIHPDDFVRIQHAFRSYLAGEAAHYRCEFRLHARDGTWRWVYSRGVIVARDEQRKPLAMTGIVTDITARKENENLTWRHAHLDALTGLPNRRFFHERLELELLKARRTNRSFALLFVDLDRFKQVNDWLGHDAGDQVLIEASHRIQACVRQTDTVSRIGGDEFTIILSELAENSHVEAVCQKILVKMSEPFRIGAESAYISASVGVTLYPLDASSADDLIRKADQAMYAAKKGGKHQFKYFMSEMDEIAHRRLQVANELRHALRNNELAVYYQPVVELGAGQIEKAEALVRWTHPRFGVIAPSTFIPLAEEIGLIGELGDWVLEQVVHHTKRWEKEIGRIVQISVNQSPLQFESYGKGEDRLQSLVQAGALDGNIVIEITEGTLLRESMQVREKLIYYRDAGIQVALDDFGTGYSSMAYLQKLDIDYLKIDQSFVSDIITNHANRAIAKAIISMAHELGLKVIAEGIETTEQMACLTQAGCDFGQGYLFSPPVPLEEFENILLNKNISHYTQLH
jgi:diguanylate cyclase (GGDEF)-like protein/PAS domain S-box-containing protein